MKFRHRTASLAGWAVWAVTFVFASALPTPTSRDVTLARASRVTPAVQTAQATLAAAMSARDRECKGKFCREREATVNERRQGLDTAWSQYAVCGDHGVHRCVAEVNARLTEG